MILYLTINGAPIPQPRQRHKIIAARGRKPFVSNYTPAADPVNAYKQAIRLACRAQHKGQPVIGPVRMHLEFHFQRPMHLLRNSSPMGTVPHTARGDSDNLAKAVLDSLAGLLFVNDMQVYDLRARKFYCAFGSRPCTVIEVEWDAARQHDAAALFAGAE